MMKTIAVFVCIDTVYDVPAGVYDFYESRGVDIESLIDLNDGGQHYIDNVLSNLKDKGLKHFRKLNIWDKDFVEKYNLQDPRNWSDKLILFYLDLTNKYSQTIIIRAIDKILKKVY